MLFRVIALLFALVFPVSALASTETVAAIGSAGVSLIETDIAGALVRPSGDGMSDERPPDESPAQWQFEGAIDPAAPMAVGSEAIAPLVTMSRPRPYAMAAWCAPCLAGPQRPPCGTFVSA